MNRISMNRLGAILALPLASAALATSGDITLFLEPDADTFVGFGKFDPPENQGASPILELGRFSIFSDTVILIRFDLSGIPNDAIITGATLRMFAGPAPYNSGDSWSLTQITQDWDENGPDQENVPDANGLSTSAPSAANPVIDVTAFVIDWVEFGTPNHGWLIDNKGFNDGGNFFSKEGGTPPELEVSYLLPPPACEEDLDGDDEVGASDLAALLAAWGDCGECPEDLDNDGAVGPADLALLLAAWGPCLG